jgi:hypothetical protein
MVRPARAAIQVDSIPDLPLVLVFPVYLAFPMHWRTVWVPAGLAERQDYSTGYPMVDPMHWLLAVVRDFALPMLAAADLVAYSSQAHPVVAAVVHSRPLVVAVPTDFRLDYPSLAGSNQVGPSDLVGPAVVVANLLHLEMCLHLPLCFYHCCVESTVRRQ